MKYKIHYHIFRKYNAICGYIGPTIRSKDMYFIIKGVSPKDALKNFNKRKHIDDNNIVVTSIYDIINKKVFSPFT